MTSGASILSNHTIFSHVQDFGETVKALPPSRIALALAGHFRSLVDDHLSANPQQTYNNNHSIIDFLVAGYESDRPACFRALVFQQAAGETLTFAQPSGATIAATGGCVSYRLEGDFNFAWIGDVDVVNALNAGRVFPLGLYGLQDAVDLIYFFAQASERTKRFSGGADGTTFGMNHTIGGAFDVAVIRRKDGLQTITKKTLEVRDQINMGPRLAG